ncbi:hypothetical protein [Tahibacter aquaticus]|uniref:hypothetical protein n=1 Tax=Tahibacter aquaticus TaxID=520092 RepID=UPI0010609243|nr:hypothetical protein [Tahibacter aquaticus]
MVIPLGGAGIVSDGSGAAHPAPMAGAMTVPRRVQPPLADEIAARLSQSRRFLETPLKAAEAWQGFGAIGHGSRVRHRRGRNLIKRGELYKVSWESL